MADHIYRRFRAEDEPALARLEGTAFAVPVEEAPRWFDLAGRDQLRILQVGDEVVGGLVVVPMGLFVHGCSLSTWGVAGVAIAPERRGERLGHFLMASMLREARDAGAALSSLYASTRTLYRGVGYGVGGSMRKVELPTDALRCRGASTDGWRRGAADDHGAIEACYRRRAAQSNGLLDRGPYQWARLRRGDTVGTWVRERGGKVVAYVSFVHKRTDVGVGWNRAEGLDWSADTVDDLRSLVALVHGFRSMTRATTLHVQVDDPLLDVLDEPRWEVVLEEGHMVRIVDVAKALEERGYGATQRGRVVVQIVDDVLPENAGPWTIEVDGGTAQVRRGGEGGVRIEVRALSALLTGYSTPASLVRRGLLDRDDPALALLAAPSPSCLDFY